MKQLTFIFILSILTGCASTPSTPINLETFKVSANTQKQYAKSIDRIMDALSEKDRKNLILAFAKIQFSDSKSAGEAIKNLDGTLKKKLNGLTYYQILDLAAESKVKVLSFGE